MFLVETGSRVELGLKYGLTVLVAAFWTGCLGANSKLAQQPAQAAASAPLDLGVEDVAVELPLAVDLLQDEDLTVAFAAFGFLALGSD